MYKWIGAIIGYIAIGSFGGALTGFFIGALVDIITGAQVKVNVQGRTYSTDNVKSETSDNSFLYALMGLAAHVIQADGKIMHSEMELVRRFLLQNMGQSSMKEGEGYLLQFFEYRKQHGSVAWKQHVQQMCGEIAFRMQEEHRIQLVAFLCEIAKADGKVDSTEIVALKEIAVALRLSDGIIDQMLSLGGGSLEDAYKVLGLTPQATDDEVRKAYRKMALQHHPDRVATLGEEVKEAANRKFQEINEAKEKIFKARGMK